MFLLKFLNFLKIKFKKKDTKETIAADLLDNIVGFNEFVQYRLKFNSEKNIYQKVLEYDNDDLD